MRHACRGGLTKRLDFLDRRGAENLSAALSYFHVHTRSAPCILSGHPHGSGIPICIPDLCELYSYLWIECAAPEAEKNDRTVAFPSRPRADPNGTAIRLMSLAVCVARNQVLCRVQARQSQNEYCLQ